MNPADLNQEPRYPFKWLSGETKEASKAQPIRGTLAYKVQLIRGMLAHREELLALDPWLAFPQNCCCFSFGKNDSPMPIGALFLLWEKWLSMTGDCSECGGKVYGYGFGGVLSFGGVTGVCLGCGKDMFRYLGGFSHVGDLANLILKGTPFYLKTFLFGGCFGSGGLDLRKVLEILGWKDLPPPWAIAELNEQAWSMRRVRNQSSSPEPAVNIGSSVPTKPADPPERKNGADDAPGKKPFFARLARFLRGYWEYCK